jgi:hypothetical protein
MQKVRCRTVLRHSASTACRHTVSGPISLPSPGCFSPFPRGTRSLSVSQEYLALRDGPRRFSPDCTCPAILRYPLPTFTFCLRGCHPLWPAFPCRSTTIPSDIAGPTTPRDLRPSVWALPSSLAATRGIEVSFFSCRYLDVSVPCVGHLLPGSWLVARGFSHSEISGSQPVSGSPKLIAAAHVLLRL